MGMIRLMGFKGELPRFHQRILPEGTAQTAINCRIDTGALESIKNPDLVQSTELENVLSLHRYSDSVWLESTADADWVPYPVANDEYGRLIYVIPNSTPPGLRVTDGALVGAGGAPSNYYNLAVPAPTQGFPAALVGDPTDEEEVPETRYYVCTFVNHWGAEGPPSPPSNQVEWRSGQTVQLTSLPAVPSGQYNIAYRRIYRINTGSSGNSVYQYVTEVAVSAAQRAISAITQANPVVVTVTGSHGFLEGQEIKFTNLGLSSTVTAVSGISKTNPCQVNSPNHGLVTGQSVEMGDLGSGNGMDELNGNRYQITVTNSANFTLNGVDATGYVDYVSGGTVTRAYGMDELNTNQYFVSVISDSQFSLQGIDGTGFKPYLQAGYAALVAGNSYIDGVPSESLAEALPTELYDPPNSAIVGIKLHPAGFLVGYFGSTLCMSEPGAPHAWPIDYRLVTQFPIVGLGIYGNTIVVTTTGWPYIVVGSDPASMTMIETEIEQSCTSKRGIVDFGAAIVYPSPDGLIMVGNGVPTTNVAAGIFTRDQWNALDPSSFVAFNWEQLYLCFYDNGTTQRGFIIDPFDPEAGVRYVSSWARAGYKDVEEDLLYLVLDDDTIRTWDQASTNLTYTWKSKPYYAPRAVNFSACKVRMDAYPATLEFYVDDVLRYTRVHSTDKPFRLPGGFRGEKFEVTIKGTNKVSEVILATTMTELSLTV